MGFKSRTENRHCVIPDPQVRDGVSTHHILHAANYIRDHRPTTIIILGDWYDLPSLSSYHSNRSREGQRFLSDRDSGDTALREFIGVATKDRAYSPRVVYTLGNHEYRLERYIANMPELLGTIELTATAKSLGIEVYPFLQPCVIDGIAYCHFFPQNANGDIMQQRRGAPSAQAQVRRVGMSCTAGHRQGLDYHIQGALTERRHGLIAGSFYAHQEDYKTPMGNDHWQGIVMKNRVNNGDYDFCPVNIDYLEEKYG